jgi:hypothetical protein
MTRTLRRAAALVPFLALCLVACGGGDASIGGTLSGLPSGSTITLQDNAGDNLVLSANGDFSFATSLAAGSTYAVTVLVQPVGATCAVNNASGTVDSYGSEVDSVVVTCTSTATVVGTVSGLASGTSVTLVNGSLALAIATNGAFAFPGVLSAGTTYNVVVGTPPAGQTCTVTNGAGSVVANTQTAITVVCS